MAISACYNTDKVRLYVGDTFHNDNGSDYIVVAINPEKDRVLLVPKDSSKYAQYIVAVGISKNSHGHYYWAYGHYFMDNLESAVKYLYGKEDE